MAGIAIKADPKEAQSHLHIVREAYHQFDAFHRLDSAGNVLFSEPDGAAEAGIPLPSPVVIKVPETPGALMLTEPFTSPRTGLTTVYLAARMTDGGSIVGELSLQMLQGIADHGADQSDLHPSIAVLSKSGLAMAQSQPSKGGGTQAQSGGKHSPVLRSGLSLDNRVPGFLILTTAYPIQPTGWKVVIETQVFSSLRGVFFGGLLALVVVITLAVGLVLNYGRQLRRSVATPLSVLNQRATKLAKGDFSDDVSFSTVMTSFHEVAELAGNFQRMQHAVQQRQVALQASEKRFRATAELLPDMIFELDVHRRITFANRTVSRQIGYTSRDFEAGMNLDQLVVEDYLPILEEAFLDLAGGKIHRLLILYFMRRTRQVFPVEVSMAAMRDDDGLLCGFRCTARDITERLKSEEALQRSFHLFTEGPVVVFRVNIGEKRQVEYVSPNVTQFGYQTSDFLQSPDFFMDIIHPNDQPRIQKETDAQLAAGAGHYAQEYRLRCSDSSYRWVFAFTSVTRNGGGRPAYLDWYIMDITERKKDEERIQVQVQRLNTLQTIGAFIENNANIHFTLQTIVVKMIEMLRVDGAAILRYDKATDRLFYMVHDGFHIEDPARYVFLVGESYPGMVALSRKPVPVAAPADVLAAEFKFPEMAREKFTAYYGLPLMVKGELQGVLEIFHRSRLADNSEWLDFVDTLAGQAAVAIYNSSLLDNLQHSNAQLEQAYEDTIIALAKTIDVHDNETQEHCQRLRDMTGELAKRVGMNETEIKYARIGALLHDIGKIGIPASLLNKKEELTPLEREFISQHPRHAEKILGDVEYLRPALDIPRYHHEKYDGTGYPYKLKGEEIPLVARIFAIIDVWDALIYARNYREGKEKAWSKERARNYLRSQKGKYFDPHLVDLFLEMVEGEERSQKKSVLSTLEKAGKANCPFVDPFTSEEPSSIPQKLDTHS
jgi:PAS domain S-box-containing protein